MGLKINKQIISTALLLSSSTTFTVPPLLLLCCGKAVIYISCFSRDTVFFPTQLLDQNQQNWGSAAPVLSTVPFYNDGSSIWQVDNDTSSPQ